MLHDGLDAEAYDRSYDDRVLLRRILGYFRPVRRQMLLVAATVVLSALVDAAVPLALASGVDRITRSHSLAAVSMLVAIILLSGVLSWICNFIRQRFSAAAVGDVVLQLRLDAFGAVMARDLSFYDEYASGKIVSRVTSDTQDFSTVVTLALNLLSQVLLMCIMIGVLLTIDVSLTLLTLLIAPAMTAGTLIFRRVARTFSQRSQRALARVNAAIQEAITGIVVAKSFRQEATMYGEFRLVNEQRYQVNVREGLIYNGIFPLLFMVTGFGTTVVVFFGGRSVLDHGLSAGHWYLFVQSIGIFWIPLISIASFWSQFQQGLSASERSSPWLTRSPECGRPASAR